MSIQATRLGTPVPLSDSAPDVAGIHSSMVATKPAQVRYAQDHMKPVQLNGQTYNFKQLQALIGSLPDAEKKNYPFTYYNGKDAQGHIRLKVVLKLTPETKAVLARAAEKANFLN